MLGSDRNGMAPIACNDVTEWNGIGPNGADSNNGLESNGLYRKGIEQHDMKRTEWHSMATITCNVGTKLYGTRWDRMEWDGVE